MGININDRKEVDKILRSRDYTWDVNEGKYKNGNKQAIPSESGQSIKINGTTCNSVADVRRSTK